MYKVMTRASSPIKARQWGRRQRRARAGFSLVEVVIATGLCTYALVVIACLLPMGLGTVQTANGQIIQTEIFNRIWLEANTVPFYKLPNYYRVSGGTYGADGTTNPDGLSFFDKDGGELGISSGGNLTAGSVLAARTGGQSVYFVYCALVNAKLTTPPALVTSATLTRLGNNSATTPPTTALPVPTVDGMGVISGGTAISLTSQTLANAANPQTTGATTSAGAGLNVMKIIIGFHIDPTTAGLKASDPRLTTRSFVIAKRDTYNGN